MEAVNTYSPARGGECLVEHVPPIYFLTLPNIKRQPYYTKPIQMISNYQIRIITGLSRPYLDLTTAAVVRNSSAQVGDHAAARAPDVGWMASSTSLLVVAVCGCCSSLFLSFFSRRLLFYSFPSLFPNDCLFLSCLLQHYYYHNFLHFSYLLQRRAWWCAGLYFLFLPRALNCGWRAACPNHLDCCSHTRYLFAMCTCTISVS